MPIGETSSSASSLHFSWRCYVSRYGLFFGAETGHDGLWSRGWSGEFVLVGHDWSTASALRRVGRSWRITGAVWRKLQRSLHCFCIHRISGFEETHMRKPANIFVQAAPVFALPSVLSRVPGAPDGNR